MTEEGSKYLVFTGKSILGFALRLAVVAPIILMLTGFDDGTIASFAIVVIVAHAVMLLLCTTLIPAEYAIKTDLKVLEFNLWSPQKLAIYGFAAVCFGMTYFLAIGEMYWYAGILFAYGIANSTWPKYVEKIDMASKMSMIEKLSGENV